MADADGVEPRALGQLRHQRVDDLLLEANVAIGNEYDLALRSVAHRREGLEHGAVHLRRNDFLSGVRKVVVAAPVKEALNIVMGCNDRLYDPARHDLVTAASCTTNCLAPVVKVIQEKIGIVHGLITTLHDVTNTQVVVDAPHKDFRRARSALNSLIPTTLRVTFVSSPSCSDLQSRFQTSARVRVGTSSEIYESTATRGALRLRKVT